MADEQDLMRAQSDELDLQQCDLRGADLSGRSMGGRNFTGALLEKARCENTDFSNSVFTGATMSSIRANGANFAGAKLNGHAVAFGQFQRATFIGANLRRWYLSKSDFTGADFRGADFSGSTVKEDNEFSECITDESTNFDGVTILRSTARMPAFRHYEFKAGKLVRKTELPLAWDADASAAGQTPEATGLQGETIRRQLIENLDSVQQLARTISLVLIEEIDARNSAIPNDPERLEQHRSYTNFLSSLQVKFDRLAKALTKVDPAANANSQALTKPTALVAGLREEIIGWAESNKRVS